MDGYTSGCQRRGGVFSSFFALKMNTTSVPRRLHALDMRTRRVQVENPEGEQSIKASNRQSTPKLAFRGEEGGETRTGRRVDVTASTGPMRPACLTSSKSPCMPALASLPKFHAAASSTTPLAPLGLLDAPECNFAWHLFCIGSTQCLVGQLIEQLL